MALVAEELDCLRRHGVLRQVGGQAEVVEFGDCVREQIDAHAEWPEFRDPIDHCRPQATAMQRQCGGQPADASASDEDAVVHVSRLVAGPP